MKLTMRSYSKGEEEITEYDADALEIIDVYCDDHRILVMDIMGGNDSLHTSVSREGLRRKLDELHLSFLAEGFSLSEADHEVMAEAYILDRMGALSESEEADP